ncbi:glycoside hydrolase family 10 protein [Streptomyces alkaliterrae]|uniref:Family 10 glycosylhydrolase n=1 Tax=Streptomyces alkaliterrae TaxID=2213162 RepID=A0A5P0YSH7_9ACTN|nr:family 10 glycosylhydrolase [Streptomyces alkaliterrae]MBB1256716.1 family 10 glycosylhydrolase [Streptomyces alkaliterrae]MBB1261864.1 family 10 glycosylhydrolase [Streptomyces alkaliterrae]MQS03283.1 family 10 glycosylhydrolase [Streptomyces alkaliterrae]
MGRITRRAFAAVAAGALTGALSTASGGPAAATGTETTAGAATRRGRSTSMRGMWVATVENIDWPKAPGRDAAAHRRELRDLLDTAVRRRLNTVFLQVRPAADALWPSPHEPWSVYLTGTQGEDPGWDPLGYAVEEAHARGLALHAWFNPYRVANHADRERLVGTHPARRNPTWAVPYGGKLYYNPGLPEVREFVLDAMYHAVENYAVDGVHWDDYFYPYPVAGQRFDDDDAFRDHGGDFTSRADWRRDNVDQLVLGMRKRLRDHKKVAFGISPFAVWRNHSTDPAGSRTSAGVQTYDDLYADTRKWVREGWLDYVVPQVYWHMGFRAADYRELVPWWNEVAKGTGVRLYIGEAAYKVADPAQPDAWHDPAELSRHLTFCREHRQVRGNVFFSAKHVAADPIGAITQVVRDHYR